MPTEDKVTAFFRIADDFCNFFNTWTTKYTVKIAPDGNITVIQPY